MHNNVKIHAEMFFETYFSNTKANILEIGSLDVNGSLKETAFKYASTYTGIDFKPGKGVDVVLEDPYSFPFKDNTFDVIISASCFEHSEMFWLTFLEGLRILKPTGLLWLCTPGAFMTYHQYPVDCWRFFPDSGIALQKWANRNKFPTLLLESYMSVPSAIGECTDAIGIFLKDVQHKTLYPARIIKAEKNRNKWVNAHLEEKRNTYPINPNSLTIPGLPREIRVDPKTDPLSILEKLSGTPINIGF